MNLILNFLCIITGFMIFEAYPLCMMLFTRHSHIVGHTRAYIDKEQNTLNYTDYFGESHLISLDGRDIDIDESADSVFICYNRKNPDIFIPCDETAFEDMKQLYTIRAKKLTIISVILFLIFAIIKIYVFGAVL